MTARRTHRARRPVRRRFGAALLLIALVASAPAHADEQDAEPPATDDAVEQTVERGPVTAEVRLEPAAGRIGDPLRLSIRVTADDGVDVLMPEFGQALDRFVIRDFVPRQSVADDGRNVFEQNYVLAAPRSGEHRVPSILVEFIDRRDGHRPAPDGEDSYELVTEPLAFTVASVVPEDIDADLAPPAATLDPLPTGGGVGATGFVMALLALAGAAAVFVYLWQRNRLSARRASAYEVARRRLAVLLARPKPGPDQVDAFFVELTDIVRRYLEDRFELHAPELTTEEFLEVAAASGDLTDEHRRFLRDFLRTADMVKFAGAIPAADEIDAALAAADTFIEQTKDEQAAASTAGAAPVEAPVG